jgi:sigma-E factor negative regulatory protein RseC
MLTEQGIVEKVYGEKATVRVQRSSACAHCDSSGSCEIANDKIMTIELSNELHAKIDDRVEISLPANSLLKLSFVVYFLPVVGLIAGASLGHAFASYFGASDATGALTGGVMGLVGAYFTMKRVNSGARTKMEYRPRITRILSAGGSPRGDNISDHTADTVLTRPGPVPLNSQAPLPGKDR